MQGLFIGAAITVAIVGGIAVGKPALADGPGTDERNALSQLAPAGAPLVEETSPNASPSWNPSAASLRSSTTSSPPSGPAAVSVSSVPPPAPGPEVQPQLPDVPVPNPLDWLNNLDPTKWAEDGAAALVAEAGHHLRVADEISEEHTAEVRVRRRRRRLRQAHFAAAPLL